MREYKILGILILVGLLITFMPIPTSAARTNPRSSDDIDLQIINAYYADLDNDGLQDDIRIVTELNVNNDAVKGNVLKWDFKLKIILPSGNYYICSASLITSAEHQYIIFDALNTVTESGYYTAILTAKFTNHYNELESSIYTFDPPEKGGNGTPTLLVSSELI